MPESAPEVAVMHGTVLVRWEPDGPWFTMRRTRHDVATGRMASLPDSASRLVDLNWSLRGVSVGDIYPVGGVPGDCPVHWQVYPGVPESWWCCTLPAGHERGPDALPHVAASYSRVDAVLDDASAQQALLSRSATVRLAEAS